MKSYLLIGSIFVAGLCCAQEDHAQRIFPFDISFTALVLQPNSTNLHYAVEAIPLPAPSPNWNIFEIAPKHHFGFELAAGWNFRNADTSLRLDWQHFKSTDRAAAAVGSENMVGPFFEIGPDASAYKNVIGETTFHFDMVTLNYGLTLDYDTCAQASFLTGVTILRLTQTSATRYANNDNTIFRVITVPNSFVGAGPQCSVDFWYDIARGFYYAGHAMGSLLVGKMQDQTVYQSTSPALQPLGVTPPNTQTVSVPKRTQLVPGFEGKLGLGYSYSF